MKNKVVILGSLNVDTTLHVANMPLPGETITAQSKTSSPGGKGANQAVAAARSNAEASFIGQVGADDSGKMMIKCMKNNNINADNINVVEDQGTGSAVILLDGNGQNSIMVYGGANQSIGSEVIEQAHSLIANADFIIAQFETPQERTLEAFKIAKENGVKTILNPAPAATIIPELLNYTDLIVPNETESGSLTGIEVTDVASMDANAAKFAEMGAKNIIITVGDKGAYYSANGTHGFVPAFKVDAVDTTAAGDTFIGALSSQLNQDFGNIEDALIYAQKASSITVQSMGALPSIPTAEKINETYK
ncbi:ribokinase [Lentilactobacillus kribbianus]|uniref:ribokinase n=1 Tax=Lentilactobacillus kribbianus TaxID=2729622 RepID=UPI0015530DFB|nr:ribokinase [Lentilactobacillus kribbianus]